jgi:SAM-dependent methyltransferase
MGWEVHGLDNNRALMTYRENPLGSSSITFRRHRDIDETLEVIRRHHLALPVWITTASHANHFRVLLRRFAGGLYRGNFERAAACIPKAGTILKSLILCWHQRWLGRRSFYWVSSIDPNAGARLHLLATAMAKFYCEPGTRCLYQSMPDSNSSAQPETEAILCSAVMAGKPSTVLEIGCGSGRIYARLCSGGFAARYTGLEMSAEVIESNKRRFPAANWICGNAYNLPVDIGSQDCVFAYYVLEHCVYPLKFLESMSLAIKPGGYIIITFPDMAASGIFGSQSLGWDDQSAKKHLQQGRLVHAFIRLWDSRVRLPLALRRAASQPGAFLVNLRPRCLETGINIEPDVDAVYVANRREVAEWARSKGYAVHFPAGEGGGGALKSNVLMQIIKPVL